MLKRTWMSIAAALFLAVCGGSVGGWLIAGLLPLKKKSPHDRLE
jgi:hypothetical protein